MISPQAPIVSVIQIKIRFPTLPKIRAGNLLLTLKLPTALLSITADAGETSLYLGSNDGRIFEASLISCGPDTDPADTVVLAGHTRAVNSLVTTPTGCHLVSG